MFSPSFNPLAPRSLPSFLTTHEMIFSSAARSSVTFAVNFLFARPYIVLSLLAVAAALAAADTCSRNSSAFIVDIRSSSVFNARVS